MCYPPPTDSLVKIKGENHITIEKTLAILSHSFSTEEHSGKSKTVEKLFYVVSGTSNELVNLVEKT